MHPYSPLPDAPPRGPFVVLEGVSGIGKSSLARILADRLGASMLHTLPDPLSGLSSIINSTLRPLPQFGFYLSGLLHASDLVRERLARGPVVADRYASSVTACHAAVHQVDVGHVVELMNPFWRYLVQPDRTFYLRCSERALRERMATKTDVKHDDLDLLQVPGRLQRLVENFDAVAAVDPSAVVLDTDGLSPDALADQVLRTLEAARA